MAKSPKQDKAKESARSLYMTGQFQQKEIAEIVGVSARTLVRWVAVEKWDVIFESLKSSKEKRIAKYQKYLNEIEIKIENRDEGDRLPTNPEIDQMAKIENIIKKLQDKASVGEIVQFSRNVCLFVQAYDVEKSKEISGIFDAYIKSLV